MNYDQTKEISEHAIKLSGVWCVIGITFIFLTVLCFLVQQYYGEKANSVWDEYNQTSK